MNSEQRVNVSLQSKITIAHEPFHAVLQKTPEGIIVGAGWENSQHHRLGIGLLMEDLSLPLPELLNWEFELKDISLYYDSSEKVISMRISTADGQRLLVSARMKQEIYGMQWNPDFSVPLHCLPVVGSYFEQGDGITLKRLQVIYARSGGFRVKIFIDGVFRGLSCGFGEASENPEGETERETEISLAQAEKKSDIHWVEINKKLGPVFLRRIGGGFVRGAIRVSLDADMTISILTLSVMGLHLNIKPGKKFEVSGGLEGLAIAVSKPPLYLSGGLYVAEPWKLFNGQLTVRYGRFGFQALGSYGTSESGRSSLFAYLMLNYPVGGPPCFYVTGICAGFGVNRKIKLPDLKNVKKFPLVAAVRGTGGALRPESSTAEVLNVLSDVIEPHDGVSFLTAGVKFTSFGMVESVVMVNAEFGSRFELSLLGVSEISLPPKSADPLIYGCLNLRAVFCPDDGILMMEGAMSDDSYLFSRSARLTGGFAFYSWFKGEHAGDFVLSVGGYHPKFQRRHYPAVDRVGLNWVISKNLDLKGEAYFALTSNCLMAGGRLELNYHAGKLRAWCQAYADFLIQWKPFYYDIAVGVSVGASYRLDAAFIHHTFKVELGARLHLWGPEFSGTARINWHIISFTIHFNSGSKNVPPKLGWREFRDEFLPSLDGGAKGGLQGEKLARLNICRGELGVKKSIYYIDSAQFEAEIEAVVPLSCLKINGTDKEVRTRALGIVPMGVTALEDTLEFSLYRLTEGGGSVPVPVDGEVVCKSLPRALWDVRRPDMNDDLMPDVMMGYRFSGQERMKHYLPPETGAEKKWYQMDELSANEEYHCPYHYRWSSRSEVENRVEENQTAAGTIIENQERDRLLSQMKEYGIRQPEEIETAHFAEHLDQLLFSPMEMRSTGYRKRDGGITKEQ